MQFDRTAFFSYARRAPFGGKLTQGQVDGCEQILGEFERRKLTDVRWLAYMLATTLHETASKMQPVREAGGEKYLRGKKYYPWVGEGLVQVTWEANHRKFGATAPGQLMTWPIALKALFDGMIKGMFTGKCLPDYFNVATDDPVGARRIVNGIDKAKLIATYHKAFLDALQAAEAGTPSPADVSPEAAKPDDIKASQSAPAITAITSAGAGTVAVGVLGAINSPWALAALALLLIASGIGAWLYFSGRITINRSPA